MTPKRFVVVSFFAILAGIPTPVSSSQYGELSFENKLESSGLVAYVAVSNVDVTAGDEEQARTNVEFQVLEVLAGDAPSSQLSFELPEGQLIGAQRFLRMGATPGFVETGRYLVFLVNGTWKWSPVTNWQFGILHERTIDSQDYLIGPNGHCIIAVTEDQGLVPGPYVADPLPEAGPVLDGEQTLLEPARSDAKTPIENTRCLDRDSVLRSLADTIQALGFNDITTDLRTSSSLGDPMVNDLAEREAIEPSSDPVEDEVPPAENE